MCTVRNDRVAESGTVRVGYDITRATSIAKRAADSAVALRVRCKTEWMTVPFATNEGGDLGLHARRTGLYISHGAPTADRGGLTSRDQRAALTAISRPMT